MENFIDISSEEKRKEVFELFEKLSSKSEILRYYHKSGNAANWKYISNIGEIIGFDFKGNKKNLRNKICEQCGKEFIAKYKSQRFCSSKCSAIYNNTGKHRSEETKKKISESLKKKKPQIKVFNKKEISRKGKICPECGKTFNAENKNQIYCSTSCSLIYHHKLKYDDFLKNPEDYCNGGYTPRPFKKDFLREQSGTCAICGCEMEHNGKPLVFILDHIDGDASNNKRENLRMICPNCDSQLDTYKSKNKNSKRRNYWKEHIIKQLKNNRTEE